MPDGVAVLVPWRGGCPHRERVWKFLEPRYPWPVVESTTEPWNKSRAIAAGLAELDAEIVVVADADVWVSNLDEAVEQVVAGAPWAIPHKSVWRLTERSTEQWMAGAEPWNLETTQRPYRGMEGGGYIVARRETLLETPPDSRFEGWGQEDESQALALRCLAGPPWRGKAPLVHLWHPEPERLSRRWGSIANRQLAKRYIAAKNDPAAMRSLLNEIYEHQPADQSPLCSGPAGAGV